MTEGQVGSSQAEGMPSNAPAEPPEDQQTQDTPSNSPSTPPQGPQTEGTPPNARPRPPGDDSPKGYYELADRMLPYENELAIFRNFKRLNILTLLRLQAEIQNLQTDLESERKKDDNSNGMIITGVEDKTMTIRQHMRESFSSSVYDMEAVYNDKAERKEGAQYLVLLKIQQKLKEYNDLILLFSQICKMQSPDDVELSSIQHYIFNERMKRELRDSERLVYEPKALDEYILLQRDYPEKHIIPSWGLRVYDFCQKLLEKPGGNRLGVEQRRTLYWREQKKKVASKEPKQNSTTSPEIQHEGEEHDPESLDADDRHYKKSWLIWAGDWLAPLLASVLLVSASLILFAVPGPWNKLFTMIPLTVVFSFIVKSTTSATRSETFAIIAGFVTVELVFIGNVSRT